MGIWAYLRPFRSTTNYNMRIALIGGALLIFAFSTSESKSQTIDNSLNENLVEDIIENITEQSDTEPDYSELENTLVYFFENPVNINSDNVYELKKLYLVTDAQINAIRYYTGRYGELKTIYELQAIEGFDLVTLEKLQYFITTTNSETTRNINLGIHKKTNVKNEILMRYSTIIQKKEGYRRDYQTWPDKPGNYYIGDNYGLYFRYKGTMGPHIHFGFLAENDPGEPLFKANYPDTLKTLSQGRLNQWFDFTSAFVQIKELGIIKSLVIGDFKAGFGQGLTLWGGPAISAPGDAVSVKKFAGPVKPNTSACESGFFRGVAGSFKHRNINLNLLFSHNKIDANITLFDTLTNTALEASSLQYSGYHRTTSELSDKNSLQRTVFSGNINLSNYWLRVGLSTIYCKFGSLINPDTALYNIYYFRGREMFNSGFDFNLLFGKLNIFGEIGTDKNLNPAFLGSILINLFSAVDLVFSVRAYSKKYHNPFGHAFGVNSVNSNESGVYAGIHTQLSPTLKIAAYCNIYNEPWLQYTINNPTGGVKSAIIADWKVNRRSNISLRIRSSGQTINTNLFNSYFKANCEYRKISFRSGFQSELSKNLRIKSRMEYNTVKGKSDTVTSGTLCFLEVQKTIERIQTTMYLRYSMWDCAGWDNRIYVYENDVYTAFTVPAYDGKGCGAYLLIRKKIGTSIDVWLRYSLTKYHDRKVISSGKEAIDGNIKSDLKIQVRYTF